MCYNGERILSILFFLHLTELFVGMYLLLFYGNCSDFLNPLDLKDTLNSRVSFNSSEVLNVSNSSQSIIPLEDCQKAYQIMYHQLIFWPSLIAAMIDLSLIYLKRGGILNSERENRRVQICSFTFHSLMSNGFFLRFVLMAKEIASDSKSISVLSVFFSLAAGFNSMYIFCYIIEACFTYADMSASPREVVERGIEVP